MSVLWAFNPQTTENRHNNKNQPNKNETTPPPPNSSFSEQFEFLLLPVTATLTGQAEVTRGLWLIALCLSYFSCCFDEICDKEDLEGKSMVMAEDHVVCMAGKTDGLRGFSRKSRGVRQRASAEMKAAQVSPSFLVRLNPSLCNGAAPFSLLSSSLSARSL